MNREDDQDGPFHKHKPSSGAAMEFSVDAIERLEMVGRLVTTGRIEFELGQLVKPRSFAPIILTGPCAVIELMDEPVRFHPKDRDIEGYAFDMRIAYNCSAGHIHSLLVERWMFEPYTGIVIFGNTQTEKPAPGIV